MGKQWSTSHSSWVALRDILPLGLSLAAAWLLWKLGVMQEDRSAATWHQAAFRWSFDSFIIWRPCLFFVGAKPSGGHMIHVWVGQAPKGPQAPPIQNKKLGTFVPLFFFKKGLDYKKKIVSLRGPLPGIKGTILQGPSHAWWGLSQVWEGPSQVQKGPFQVWGSILGLTDPYKIWGGLLWAWEDPT